MVTTAQHHLGDINKLHFGNKNKNRIIIHFEYQTVLIYK